MQVVHGTSGGSSESPVLTIGNFDGVHGGHRALIAATTELARELQAPVGVLTFDPAPRDVLRPDNGIPRIQSLDQKLSHLEAAGVDITFVEPFTRRLGGLPAEAFARDFLVGRLGVRGLALGHDFRFGKGRSGTVELLRELLEVPVRQVDAALLDGAPLSSSRIRIAIGAGDVAQAARLLGRAHEVSGPVVAGEKRGRALGFPTANVLPQAGLCPPDGVYAVRLDAGSGWLSGVANLGTRPTFDGEGRVLEVHVLDFDGDLYEKRPTVGFVARIRDEQRFDGPEALVRAVRADIETARRLLR